MLREVARRIADARQRLPPVYWTIWVGTLINRLGGFVAPLLTFYLTDERRLTPAEAGAVVSLFGAGQVIGSIAGGALADRIGRRPVLVGSMLGGAAVMVALGLTRPLAGIAALTFALGAIGEAYRPAVAALIADVVPERDRLHAYGLLYWAVNLGFALAPVLGGLVASVSYPALFVVDGATMAIYGLIAWRRVPETRPAVPAARGAGVGLGDILADRVFVAFGLLVFVLCLIPFQSQAALSVHMRAQGHSPAVFGAVIAINGILIVLAQPEITRRIAGRAPERVLAASALLMGVGFFLHAPSAAIGVHAFAVSVWTLAEILQSPTASAVVAGLAAPGARGRYQGVYTMSWGLASFAGPLIGTRVLASFGPWALWGGCLGLGAAVAAGFLAWGPALRRRRRDAAAD